MLCRLLLGHRHSHCGKHRSDKEDNEDDDQCQAYSTNDAVALEVFTDRDQRSKVRAAGCYADVEDEGEVGTVDAEAFLSDLESIGLASRVSHSEGSPTLAQPLHSTA